MFISPISTPVISSSTSQSIACDASLLRPFLPPWRNLAIFSSPPGYKSSPKDDWRHVGN
jgi:hypothetical protein